MSHSRDTRQPEVSVRVSAVHALDACVAAVRTIYAAVARRADAATGNESMHGMSTQQNALWGWTSDAADASLSLDARF
jgi:hypothetical protein